MNVLLTSAGRRNYLIHYFREALRGRGKVLAADASDTAPALAEADGAFVVPPADSEHYVETLLSICEEQQVGLVVPLSDLELPFLARAREVLLGAGVTPVVSSPQVIDTCFDKLRSSGFLNAIGINTPITYACLEEARDALRDGRLVFPLVVKPRWGTASIGVEIVRTEDALVQAYELVRQRIRSSIIGKVSAVDYDRAVLIQQYLSGDEYGMDVINDLEGRYVATVVRRKLGMRAGETDRAVTVAHPTLEAIGEALGRALGHVGNLDVDAIVWRDGIGVIDLNPRFGGGYPFSHAAGVNLPAALIAWASGTAPDSKWFQARPGVVAAKCDRIVVVREGRGQGSRSAE